MGALAELGGGNPMSDQYSQELPHRRWRDDPITTVSEDRLERAPVAQRAARLIAENHTPHSSVVYGLEGPWGSGKTSVIALLTTYLTEDRSSGDEWRVVSFTPWATTGTEGLLSEFFAALKYNCAREVRRQGPQLDRLVRRHRAALRVTDPIGRLGRGGGVPDARTPPREALERRV